MKVTLLAQTLAYPDGGGHFWVYLNWALGLRAAGAEVTWLESIDPKSSPADVVVQVERLRAGLKPYGFDGSISLLSLRPRDTPPELEALRLTPARALEADLLVNFRYGLPQEILNLFRRTALIDIDPGLLQHWVAQKQMDFGRHTFYFSTGERLGQPGSNVPDLGLRWHHVRPCVALELWPVTAAAPDAPFTTVSHWQAAEWIVEANGDYYQNDKKSGFLPFLDLPGRVSRPLELALCLGDTNDWDKADRRELEGKGWRVANSHEVAGSPALYQDYIRRSYGEFSACKPSCVRFSMAWVSDRTLCYLASGKPVVAQHTGASSYLPDGDGMWRFRTLDEAVEAVNAIAADYPNQCRRARALAEEHFDAATQAGKLLSVVRAA